MPTTRIRFDQIAGQLTAFKPVATKEPDPEAKAREKLFEHVDKVRDAELKSIKGQLRHRTWNAIVAWFLLFVQNCGAWYLLYKALDEKTLKDLQLLFGAYAAATLGETVWVIKVVVKFAYGKIEWPKPEPLTPVATSPTKASPRRGLTKKQKIQGNQAK